ncbi:MAG: T9SS type A sorting domain-containing protein, partial [Prevotellaceae bacterium]|nr:T9SS type A sorting domain-containing protein [Prevotellaceae bacterium]
SGDASPEVNVSTLQPGIYHLVVMDGEEEKVARFVKKK